MNKEFENQDTMKTHGIELHFENLAHMRVANVSEMEMLRTALRKSPIQWLGTNYAPTLTHAYDTGVPGVYLCFIDYAGYNLTGIVIAQDLELRVWYDFATIMNVTRHMLEVADRPDIF